MRDLTFTVERRADGYTITQADRLLVDRVKSAKVARQLLSAYECGALLAGARVSSSMPREVRSAPYA